ncbi:DHH family phosphoesterase [Shewanella sp. A32]|uniref:DHHA1 domain-containing protein n=1 Tax=Shewanella sp. A32 TaxID=3031327 RepID=UPI0023B8D4B4|nr:DHH family phosphoesterase [Shewanella sp. A32]MDF0535702.1 DHH family phosphoesterase [Shewanella sp. A32]
MHYDVFNGDADGILSLVQLRLAEPKDAVLVTGVKRDIALLKNVKAAVGDTVQVLDISMEKNLPALKDLLANGIPISYIDHHRTGDIPDSPLLAVHIDLAPDTCTALIVNKLLNGQFQKWAIAAAFGDNMVTAARQLAAVEHLNEDDIVFLQELGTLVNYNGYGSSTADLHISPDKLFHQLVMYRSPLELRENPSSPFYKLQAAYQADMENLEALSPVHDDHTLIMYQLPDAPWAKRVSGVMGNALANDNPDKAVAVVTNNADGTLMISLRAPINNRQGAGDICSQFATGGGRAAAAGINSLPAQQLRQFKESVIAYYAHR